MASSLTCWCKLPAPPLPVWRLRGFTGTTPRHDNCLSCGMWSLAGVRTREPRKSRGDQKGKHSEGQIWIRYVSIAKRDGYIQKDGFDMETRQIKYFLAI